VHSSAALFCCQFGGGCFSGLVGALAGFAALGALIAYALFLANMAAPADGGRSAGFWPLNLEIDGSGLSLAAQLALIFLQEEEPSCLPHRLCQLNQRAHRLGPTYYLAAKLASLPAGWFLTSRLAPGGVRSPDDRSFLHVCRGITVSDVSDGSDVTARQCDGQFPMCAQAW